MPRHRTVLSVLAVLSVSALAAPAAPAAAPAGSQTACPNADVVPTAATARTAVSATRCLLNRERMARGRKPLCESARLERPAAQHSRDMVRRSYFAHTSPGGRSFARRILAARYVRRGQSWTIGENIAWGTAELGTPAGIVRAWMHSPHHRDNVLRSRFRCVGIGIALGVPERGLRDEPGATYTTDFGTVDRRRTPTRRTR
jgi:uncharacterized protein YkwD